MADRSGELMKTAFLIIAASVLLLLTVCDEKAGRTGVNLDSRQIKVVTTIGMITDIVRNVGNERVDVSGLMGPGVDPHLYRARESDVTRIAEADVIFYNGLHLEGAMTRLFERVGHRVRTVAVTDYLEEEQLLSPPEFEGAHDPHVWFDVTLWMKAVEKVRDILIEMDSTNSRRYIENAEDYLSKLNKLQDYVKSSVENIPRDKRVLITAHDAFGYFGRAYGFEVRGLQGISTSAEAGTGDVQALAQFIVDRKIPAIFVESSVPPRNIEAVRAAVKSKGFEVHVGGQLFSDAMGNPGTPEGTYIGMVKHNIDTIVSALIERNGHSLIK